VMGKRVVGGWIIKRKHLFQMRLGLRKPAGKHQGSTGGQVPQNEPAGIIALAAQTQQVLSEKLRPIEFSAESMIARLPKGHPKELRGRTELSATSASTNGSAAHRK